MRWWNDIKDDGSSEWMFESNPSERIYNATDRYVFWVALYAFAVTWLIFALLQLFNPIWFILCVIGLSLATANAVGYWKCAKDQRRQVNQWASTTAMRAMFSRFGLFAPEST